MLIGGFFFFFFLKWVTADGFRSLLALVGTNGQGIGTSSFSRWVKNVSALDLPNDQRLQIDKLIYQIYDEMDEGSSYKRHETKLFQQLFKLFFFFFSGRYFFE